MRNYVTGNTVEKTFRAGSKVFLVLEKFKTLCLCGSVGSVAYGQALLHCILIALFYEIHKFKE